MLFRWVRLLPIDTYIVEFSAATPQEMFFNGMDAMPRDGIPLNNYLNVLVQNGLAVVDAEPWQYLALVSISITPEDFDALCQSLWDKALVLQKKYIAKELVQ